MRKNVIDLEIVDELIESGVSRVSLVEMPAIDIDWMAFKKENFVEPGAKESKDEFVARCIAYNVNEGKPEDQAVAICYSMWESHAIEPNPCWSGFEPYGTKMLNGREVPNCVPVKNKKENFEFDPNLPAYVDEVGKKFAIQGIPLPRGQKVILQAEDEDYDRGLIVELKEEGGYDIQYWFQTPDNIEPSEIKVDGEIVTPSGTTVYMGFHPELYEKVTLTKQFFASEDQQILVGPAMIPDTDILRKDEKTGKPYYVRFSKNVISRIAEKFMRELRNDQTNIEHKDNNAGSYVMETWIVESEDDKLNSVYGFNVPVGSWAIKMRVQDPNTWKMIKEGKLNGFSIEGAFMTKEDYEQYRKDRSVYEKVMKILKSI
jgi:hypothetical protein